MTKYVFVVEMYIDDRWEPCAGIGIDKGQAEMTRREWEENNPDDRFRVARYERKEKP